MKYALHLLFVALCGSARVKIAHEAGTQALQAGDLFLDRYELISKMQAWPNDLQGFKKISYLGKGAFGETWLALDTKRKINVAVKFFYRQLRSGVKLLNMGNADRQEKAQLQDAGMECDTPRNIMRGKDFPAGQARFAACFENAVNDRSYAHLVLELAGTKNLEEYVAKHRLSAATIMRFAKMMLEGLVQMEGDYVHKDIKPANVMVSEDADGELFLKYIDFGLVGRENTRSGVAGTPMFMPPEMWPVVPNNPVINSKFDVYSAGETLYSLICGKTFHEFIFDSYGHLGERTIAKKLESENPASKCRAAASLAPLLQLVAGKMMQPSPENRPSASKLLFESGLFDDIETLKVVQPPPVVIEQEPKKPVKPTRPEVVVVEEDEKPPEPTFLDYCHGSKKFWFQHAVQCCLQERYDPLRHRICDRPCGPKIAYQNGQCVNDCNYGSGNTNTFSKDLQCCVARVWTSKCIYADNLPAGEGWKWMN